MKKIELAVAAALAGVVMSTAVAQDAVQWRVEDGGNGHWYSAIQFPQETDWYSAADAAAAIGGHLATATTASEAILLKELAGSPVGWLNRAGPWVGGFQNPSNPEYAEPSGGWEWITGEAWFPVWEAGSGEPNDNGGDENFLHLVAEAGVDCAPDLETRAWNDLALTYSGTNCLQTPTAMLVEWSADCNGDGIVDYGQILDGTYRDENGNGVPDCCDEGVGCDCPADITGDGQVDAADLGVLLAVWNTDGGTIPEADINGDGTVNASDLGLLLGSWGLCS